MRSPLRSKTRSRKEQTHDFGLAAERAAMLWLRLKAYRIIATRYRNHQGEIDIIATKGNVLAIVEVKARKTFEDCLEAVPVFKQQKIVRALEGLTVERSKIATLAGVSKRDIRFDVMWVVRGKLPKHLKDAWRP
jgi:putative endonuclease